MFSKNGGYQKFQFGGGLKRKKQIEFLNKKKHFSDLERV